VSVCCPQPRARQQRLNRSIAVWVVGRLRWDQRARIPPGQGAIWGLVPPLKFIRSSKERTPTEARRCRYTPRRKSGFRTDSHAAGVTSAGAMWPFVKILWPLVYLPTSTVPHPVLAYRIRLDLPLVNFSVNILTTPTTKNDTLPSCRHCL